MKLAALLLLYLLPLVAIADIQPPDTTIKGIRVKYNFKSSIFPASWMEAPINGMGESLDPSEHSRTGSVIATALSKYPEEMLRKNLNTVYVLKSITFYKVGYGGTNSNEDVYLTNNGIELGYTDDYIEQTFHHEFSSILYRNYDSLFFEIAWLNANPRGFNYNDPENGVGAIRNNESSQALDTILCARGFLTQYALSGLENDINTIAQNLFRPAPGFWQIVEKYPRIRRKAKLLIDFYGKIHQNFTEEFFRKQ